MGWPSKYDGCFDKNRTLTADPDVDGQGVVASFVANGWITVAIVSCHYLFVFDPTIPPFRTKTSSSTAAAQGGQPNRDTTELSTWTPNPIDKLISDKRSQLLKPAKSKMAIFVPESLKLWLKCEQTGDALKKCVLSLCDAQLITGLSMLLSGYITLLEYEKMSLAHWYMIINLAWFSNLTHQGGLIFLRGYLYQNSSERLWRLVLMVLLLVALACAMAPTILAVQYDTYLGAQPATPAVCFFNYEVADALFREGDINQGSITKTGAFQIGTVAFLILLLSFATRLVKLFETSSRFVRDRIRAPIARVLRGVLSRFITIGIDRQNMAAMFRIRLFFFENPALAIYLFLRICMDIYTSALSDVSWLLLSALFGTIQLGIQRSSVARVEEFDFGQVLPVMLLGAAVLPIRQAFVPLSPEPLISTSSVNTSPSTRRRSSQMSSVCLTLTSTSHVAWAPEGHFLSQAIYTEDIWLLPTLFNVVAAIFLFFQLIASSGGSDAASLVVSMAFSFGVISLACCAVILVGLTVGEYPLGKVIIWFFGLQPLGAIALLARAVMMHTISFHERDQVISMLAILFSAAAVLGVEYCVVCLFVILRPKK
ncbi:hypothetical protein SUNI508_05953 [Seiridium unicorne]|uniref:Transmembrane protein n=1 Tax=Seiridium unicorne TaxID=138068 RepID=A0ABR2V2G1_9PEZI